MKYKLVAVMVVGCAFMASTGSALAGSEVSSFKINGEIAESKNTACNIDVGQDGNISMPTVDMDSLDDNIGATSTTTDFNVKISACPEFVTSAAVTIFGDIDAQNEKLLAIPRPGDSTLSAFGFGLEFLANGSPLAVKKTSPDFTMKNGIIDIPLGVRYKATFEKKDRYAGKVSVPGQIQIDYR